MHKQVSSGISQSSLVQRFSSNGNLYAALRLLNLKFEFEIISHFCSAGTNAFCMLIIILIVELKKFSAKNKF